MKAASLKAGLGETFVRDVLERDREPIVSKLAALTKVLGVSVSEILGDRGHGVRPAKKLSWKHACRPSNTWWPTS